jgi:uncharacterized protein (PEP-CTERM system associated)
MTSSTPTGPRARASQGFARGLRAAGLAGVAVATFATPVAQAQQPTVPPPEAAAGANDEAETEAAKAKKEVETRTFAIVPTLGLAAAFTDNVALTEHDRKSDLLLRPILQVDAFVNRGRASGRLTVQGSYDQYVRSNEFSGASLSADGEASYVFAPDFLRIDAHGVVTNGRSSNFGAPAIDRSGVNGRVQLAIWDVGPRLTTKLGDFADLTAVGRFSQVNYSAANRSQINTPLPSADNILQAGVRLDTGQRFRAYELLTTGQIERDDHGYRAANGVQSLYVYVTPAVRVIARGGYERVEQKGVSTIDAVLASAGFELRPNKNSRISVEAGTRFRRTAWMAHAEVTVAERFYLRGDYNVAVQPDQVFVANSFQEFVEQSINLPPPIAPRDFRVQDNIYTEASYNKVGDFAALMTLPRGAIELTARYSNREFLRTRTRDRTALAGFVVRRDLRPDLRGAVEVSYAHTFESPVYGPSRTYVVNARLDYRANSTTDVSASYALANGKQLVAGGQTVYDNTVLVAIRKRF